MWTRIPLEVVSQASRVACQEALQREPGTAQQNCIIEKQGPTHTKETPHVCENVDEISVRSHISSDTKLQKQKKNLMFAENVGEASFGSHISGYQRRLVESSPEGHQRPSKKCLLEAHRTNRRKEIPHMCTVWARLQHLSSDTKLQIQKKNPMCAENVAKASVRSHISGYQKRLAGRSVRARNKSAKLSPRVSQRLQTQ